MILRLDHQSTPIRPRVTRDGIAPPWGERAPPFPSRDPSVATCSGRQSWPARSRHATGPRGRALHRRLSRWAGRAQLDVGGLAVRRHRATVAQRIHGRGRRATGRRALAYRGRSDARRIASRFFPPPSRAIHAVSVAPAPGSRRLAGPRPGSARRAPSPGPLQRGRLGPVALGPAARADASIEDLEPHGPEASSVVARAGPSDDRSRPVRRVHRRRRTVQARGSRRSERRIRW